MEITEDDAKSILGTPLGKALHRVIRANRYCRVVKMYRANGPVRKSREYITGDNIVLVEYFNISTDKTTYYLNPKYKFLLDIELEEVSRSIFNYFTKKLKQGYTVHFTKNTDGEVMTSYFESDDKTLVAQSISHGNKTEYKILKNYRNYIAERKVSNG
jgi:hypothetical protein